MPETIENYLDELREALAGADPATMQDALSDAEEHLRTALAQTGAEHPGRQEDEIMQSIIDQYGSPEEIAAAYKESESATGPALARKDDRRGRSIASTIFGVLAEPRAYAALLYMIISLATGIVYFTWAVTGLSLSAGFAVLIFGLPFFGLFLLSVRGLALVEGLLIEALLGVRMPRRPVSTRKDLGVWERFKHLVTSGYTWTTILYMIIHLPLGIAYFTLFITLFVLSFWSMLRPIFEYWIDLPYININGINLWTPGWTLPIVMIIGFLLLVLTLNLAKLAGRLQAAIAKAMLVKN